MLDALKAKLAKLESRDVDELGDEEEDALSGVHLFFVQFTTVGGPRPGAGLRAIDFVTT